MTQTTTAPEDAGTGLAERVSAGFVYYLPSLLVILALLVVWQVAVMALGVKEYILPSPLASLKALVSCPADT